MLQNPVRAGLLVWRMNIHGRGASRLRFRMRRQIRCSIPSTIHIGVGARHPPGEASRLLQIPMGERPVCPTPDEGILGYVHRGDVGITRDGLGLSHPPRQNLPSVDFLFFPQGACVFPIARTSFPRRPPYWMAIPSRAYSSSLVVGGKGVLMLPLNDREKVGLPLHTFVSVHRPLRIDDPVCACLFWIDSQSMLSTNP